MATMSTARAVRSLRLDRPWVAVLLGFAFVTLTLDLDYIKGVSPHWDRPSGDTAQHLIGWFYYARDAWRFPPLSIRNYHYPEYGSVVLADALPLFSLPMKVLYRLAWSTLEL